MTDKSLQDKAMNLKGKDYVQVKDRINYFNYNYKNGSIRTRLLSSPESTHYVVEAKVIPDVTKPEQYYSGHSQAQLGKSGADFNAALENAETSAVGRALAMMGIGVIDSISSVDDLNKAGVSLDKPVTKSDTKCPNCGGDMWDNRSKKASGEFNPAAPDFSCKDKSCGGKIWPPKDKPIPADGSSYIANVHDVEIN